ncbi:HAD-IA family hydrolase [Floccifex sp.]|uniref:HAD-IA family hydrolase n=1 Tax=Floccifex sp. TaxID=2815810 RepID=UPI003F0CA918
MIKNIVYDLGNVLVTFDPHSFLNELIQSKEKEQKIYDFYFKSDKWILYDQGIYSTKDLKEMGIQMFPELRKEIEIVLDLWIEYVKPIPENIECLSFFSNYQQFIISDIPESNYLYLKTNYDFLNQVNGGIFSYQEKIVKPNKKMFTRLLEKYKIKAHECVFIDDKLENVQAAQSLGFYGIHLKHPLTLKKQLEEFLHEM